MKSFLRAMQTHVPYLHDARFWWEFWWMKTRKIPHDKDFYALQHFQPKRDDIFIDIGSNRGEAILSMLLFAPKPISIVGFEPNHLVFQKTKRYFKHQKNVQIHNVGLAEESQNLSLFVPFYRKWMFDGLASFHYEAARDWLKTRLWNFKEKHLTIRELACTTRDLDSFHLKPYFVKIDVQGYELEVLKGAKETLCKHQPILLIESLQPQVIDFLKSYGYQIFRFEKDSFQVGKGNLNTFCITAKRWQEIYPALRFPCEVSKT